MVLKNISRRRILTIKRYSLILTRMFVFVSPKGSRRRKFQYFIRDEHDFIWPALRQSHGASHGEPHVVIKGKLFQPTICPFITHVTDHYKPGITSRSVIWKQLYQSLFLFKAWFSLATQEQTQKQETLFRSENHSTQ